MSVKEKVRIALLEFKDTPNLNPTDQKVVDFIIGEGITEAGNDIITRLMSVVNSKQKKFITAAVMATLMANPSFSQALKTASNNDRQVISSLMQNDNSSQDSVDSKAVFTLNFTNNFSSGEYGINQEDVSKKMESLKSFLSKNPDVKYNIKVVASESKVPNQNNLKIGQLAKLRAASLEKVINVFLKSNNIDANVDKDTRVGSEEWDGVNKDDQKYTKDQFVRLEVFADSESGITPCELSFSKDDGTQSNAKNGYVSFEETINQSGSISITPGSIPDRLVVLKGGKVVADTGYFVDKQHNYEQWNLVPLYVAQLTEIYANSPDMPAVSNLSDIKTFASFDELMSVLLKAKYDYSKDNRSEITNGINKLKQLWSSGQRSFVMYSMKKGNVNFEINQGEDGKVVVYSPVGKTGFGIKGNCE